jgi:hypothetical protein
MTKKRGWKPHLPRKPTPSGVRDYGKMGDLGLFFVVSKHFFSMSAGGGVQWFSMFSFSAPPRGIPVTM